jgi:predicted RND superfamily exporter protein
MGKLLTICIGSLMITTLVFLPAVLKFVKTAARNSSLKD